jgi:hypothetical protein
VRVPLLSLTRYSLPFFITGLTLLTFHQVFIRDIEHGRNIFDGSGDWIEESAFGIDWGLEELDLIGLEEF